MSKNILLCLLLSASCGLFGTAQAQQFIYKWNDEQGQLKYSELPPPAGIAYEKVAKPGATPPVGGKDQPKDLAKEQEELAKQLADQDAKTQADQDEERKKVEDVRTKNCELARKNVEVLQGDRPVAVADASGKKVLLEGEARQEQLQKAQKDVGYFCNP